MEQYNQFLRSTLEFEKLNKMMNHKLCHGCKMVSLSMVVQKRSGLCDRCVKRKDPEYLLRSNQLPVWYHKDDHRVSYEIPHELNQLTLAERLLIQRVSPFVPLEHIHQGVMGLKGHVCAFEQDITGICCSLPRLPNDISVVRIIRKMKSEIGNSNLVTRKSYCVNKRRVIDALVWLKDHNKEYKSIVIEESNLNWIEGEENQLQVNDINTESELEPVLAGNTDFGPSGIPEETAAITEFGYVDNGNLDYLPMKLHDQKIDLLRTINTHARKRSVDIAWPSSGETAVSEYSEINIFANSFPWLFPGGIGDIKETPAMLARDWGSRMLHYFDGRFLRDPVFTFYANNYITRQQNSSTGKWFVDSFHSNAPETLEDLKESIRNNDLSFVNSLTYSSQRVKGSSQYWNKKRNELYSWVNHHVEAGNGAPSFFITLSCAEHYWPDIIRLVKERMDIAQQDSSQCYLGSPKLPTLLNEYSIVVQEFFQARVHNWFNTIGKSVFNITHYWIRYEFAPGRGQIHAHVLCISSDGQLRLLTNIGKHGVSTPEDLGSYLRTKYGFVASVDDTDDEPEITPVAVRFSEVRKEDRQRDVSSLLRKCQLHNCSRFCMRKGVCKVGCGKEKEKDMCDTPGFPLRQCDAIEKDHRGITKILLTRSHSRLNQTPTYALQSWRGNCDVQVLLYKSKPGELDIAEIAQVVDYIIAYSCKGNATMKEELAQTKHLVMNSTDITGCQRDVHRICRQVLNKTVSSRIISKQEATVMLADLPFTYSTETVENVSVSSTKCLDQNTNSCSVLVQYGNRLKNIQEGTIPHQFLRTMSLYDFFLFRKNVLPPQVKHKNIQYFIAMYNGIPGNCTLLEYFESLKYRKHPKSKRYVIPNFVGIKSRPCYPINNQYALAVMTIYKPWVDKPSPLQDWKYPFNVFVNSKYCPKSVKLAYCRVVQRHFNKTTHVEPKQADVDHSHNAISEYDQETMDLFGFQEDESIDESDEYNLAGLPRGLDYNWNNSAMPRRNQLGDEDIPPENWINCKIYEENSLHHHLRIPLRDDGKAFSVDNLYPDQLEILLLVLGKVKEWMTCSHISEFEPLFMTINGPGGSGKSVLIQTIVSVMRTMFQTNGVVLVAAPTGSAAFNVAGETIHRLVSMGIRNSEATLSNEVKKKLVKKFSSFLCLIVDERSLLSAGDLGRAEMRIRSTIHNSLGDQSKLFGGLPVVLLVGDDYQLPAHDGIIQNMDKSEFNGSSARGIQILRECSKKVMHLMTSRRMADSQVSEKELLQKVRLGAFDLTPQEVKRLLSLRLQDIEYAHGKSTRLGIENKSVFLYYTNKKKNIKNLEKLHQLAKPENPVAIVRPISRGPRAGKSIASHFSGPKAVQSALLCVGARVAIDAVNYNPIWGLYNGACGIVKEIVFRTPGANPNNGAIPDYVVVDFPSYTGPPWDVDNPTHIPIPKATLLCTNKCCQRQMIPLVLAWAITIHRFQGQSAGPVDPGKIPNAYCCIVCDPHDDSAEAKHLGMLYTAISRATTLGNQNGLCSAFYFTGKEVTEERIQHIGKKKGSRDFYKSYVKRSKWVQLLHQNKWNASMADEEKSELIDWIRKTKFAESDIERLIIQRHYNSNRY